MAMQLKEINAIQIEIKTCEDRESWESFLETCGSVNPMQCYEFGQVKAVQAWRPKYFFIRKCEELVGAMSLLFKRIPYTKYSIAVLLMGPTFRQALRPEEIKAAYKELKKILIKEKCALIRIHPNYNFNLMDFNLKKCKNPLMYENTFIIDLKKNEDLLWNGLHKKLRNEINKAAKNGTVIIEDNTFLGIREFYSLYSATYQRTKSEALKQEVFEEVYESYLKNGHASLLFAEVEGVRISAAIFLKSNDTYLYMWGASIGGTEYQKYEGQKLLMWQAIKRAKEQSYQYFDLGGVTVGAPEGSKKYGIYTFKRKFGGELISYEGTFDLYLMKLKGRIFSKLLDWYL